MPPPRKKILPRGDQNTWVRTGGAMGDPRMEQLDDFNKDRAGVDPDVVKDTLADGGDPNAGIHLLDEKLPGSNM